MKSLGFLLILFFFIVIIIAIVLSAMESTENSSQESSQRTRTGIGTGIFKFVYIILSIYALVQWLAYDKSEWGFVLIGAFLIFWKSIRVIVYNMTDNAKEICFFIFTTIKPLLKPFLPFFRSCFSVIKRSNKAYQEMKFAKRQKTIRALEKEIAELKAELKKFEEFYSRQQAFYEAQMREKYQQYKRDREQKGEQPTYIAYKREQEEQSNRFKFDGKMDLNKALDILQLPKAFTAKKLKKAYREKVKQYHPDKQIGKSQEAIQEAGEYFKQTNSAFEYLKRYCLEKEEIKADVITQSREDTKVLFANSKDKKELDRLQEAILHHLEDDYQNRWARSAKTSILEALATKKATCEGKVTKYAGLAAVNGLNPIPGVDISVDIGVLLKLFAEIREDYALSEETLNDLNATLTDTDDIRPIVNKLLSLTTKEGIIALLTQFAGRLGAKQFSKYIPFVGQAIAATAGFGLTKWAGDSYVDDCHQVVEAILKEKLERNKQLT